MTRDALTYHLMAHHPCTSVSPFSLLVCTLQTVKCGSAPEPGAVAHNLCVWACHTCKDAILQLSILAPLSFTGAGLNFAPQEVSCADECLQLQGCNRQPIYSLGGKERLRTLTASCPLASHILTVLKYEISLTRSLGRMFRAPVADM